MIVFRLLGGQSVLQEKRQVLVVAVDELPTVGDVAFQDHEVGVIDLNVLARNLEQTQPARRLLPAVAVGGGTAGGEDGPDA